MSEDVRDYLQTSEATDEAAALSDESLVDRCQVMRNTLVDDPEGIGKVSQRVAFGQPVACKVAPFVAGTERTINAQIAQRTRYTVRFNRNVAILADDELAVTVNGRTFTLEIVYVPQKSGRVSTRVYATDVRGGT